MNIKYLVYLMKTKSLIKTLFFVNAGHLVLAYINKRNNIYFVCEFHILSIFFVQGICWLSLLLKVIDQHEQSNTYLEKEFFLQQFSHKQLN